MNGGVYMAFVLGSTDGLSEKISKAGSEQVLVTIPKIDLETDFSNGEFVDFLKANGVNLAFTDAADFSNMIDHDLYVSDIIQKTRIKLDEKGVEAAAVTAIIMPESAMPPEEGPKTFVADRPFSFYIYTTANDTTAILFAGQIVE
jgi:serpin B